MLKKAGFKTIGFIEFDTDACNTLYMNRPTWNVICNDIVNISDKNMEELCNIK